MRAGKILKKVKYMKIVTLIENTSPSAKLFCEHGLSLYIETKDHRMLFDTGASGNFIKNAHELGVDLQSVDMVIISHGHSDHGGGLSSFLKTNDKAKIYLHARALDYYYAQRPDSREQYIGLDRDVIKGGQFIFTIDGFVVDKSIQLFADVEKRRLYPSGNKSLFKEEGGKLVQDDFLHEQNCLIEEGGKKVLLAGCAHNGIANILDKVYEEKGCMPTHVIGGMHLYNPSLQESEDSSNIEELAKILLQTGAQYYTCHCTGEESYKKLKTIMGDKIEYLSTGSVLVI